LLDNAAASRLQFAFSMLRPQADSHMVYGDPRHHGSSKRQE
jgi:hypothetical protein